MPLERTEGYDLDDSLLQKKIMGVFGYSQPGSNYDCPSYYHLRYPQHNTKVVSFSVN